MITREAIDAALHTGDMVNPEYGGIATFTGVIRVQNRDRAVVRMHYDCYDALAEREIDRIVADASGQDDVGVVKVVHRVGDVPVGEVALLVAVSARRRGVAFDVCRRVVEDVKRRVPIWKKEFYNDEAFQWL